MFCTAGRSNRPAAYAGVAELADAPDLGSGGIPVQVQVLSPAPRRCGRHIVRSDFFAKVTSHSFCRSSFPNRTRCRWASIRFFILIGVSFFVNASRVVADCVSFATAFSYLKQTPSLIHSVAPPSPAKPTALRGPQIQAAHRLRHAFFAIATGARIPLRLLFRKRSRCTFAARL